jgi:hypothetical protein
MSCGCDYDEPEFCDTTWPKARKEHRCYECGYAIKRGEQYERVTGKWNGEMSTFATCERCADLRGSLAEFNGGCFCYGGLVEDYGGYLYQLLDTPAEVHDVESRIWEKHRNWGGSAS